MYRMFAMSMKAFALAMVVALVTAVSGWAGFDEQVQRDMSVESAYLISPVNQLWLVDIDASKGAQVGDLFTVVAKGDPVVHPVTKEVLGSLDVVKGVLRITKVKSGYSYAAVLKAEGEFSPGMTIKRFANLPATFWDYTGNGEGVYTDLQAGLPELDWVAYEAAQQARPAEPVVQPDMPIGLVFVLTGQGLAVKDQYLQPLRFYNPAEYGATPPSGAAAPVATAPAGQLTSSSKLTAPTPQAGGIVTSSDQSNAMPGESGEKALFGGLFSSGSEGEQGQALQEQRGGLIVSPMDSKDGVWYGPRMHGHPVGIDVGDFDGDGKNDVALCFKDRLVLAHVENGEFTPLADHAFGVYGNALSLDAIDLDRDGRMEFYVTVVSMNEVKSLALELRGNELVRVIEQIPYFLRKVQLADEGYVLLGQKLNPDLMAHAHDLAGPIFRLNRVGDSLERAGDLAVPNTLTLHGFMPLQSDGKSLLVNININDKLQLLEPSGASMWESHEYFGGTESSFERPDGLYDEGSRFAFIKPRIEPGPNGTALVPVNEGNRLFGSLRQYSNSHLRAVAFDGYSLVERWRTKPQGGYMADFRLADADNDGV
ncbi:MAG: VCBS repeat-containing protein, partial [Desulfuromonadales bacterium]|nr:VCBS repeat-containing protein [Desulfuromonadales bacterium]